MRCESLDLIPLHTTDREDYMDVRFDSSMYFYAMSLNT